MNTNEDGEIQFKFILVGESSVGKTQIINRFANGKFSEVFLTTIGCDFKNIHRTVDGQKVLLQIWDTAGHEKYRSLTKLFFRMTHGALIIFDVSEEQTFKKVTEWVDSLLENGVDTSAMVLVGNKIDLERVVEQKNAEKLAKRINVKYFETSAKEGIGITDAFEHVTQLALKRATAIEKSVTIKLDQEKKVVNETKKYCC